MNLHGKRSRFGGVLLALALGAIAMLALPAVGIGKHGSDDSSPGPRPAGTIESFSTETGELVVDLADGGSISALVVRRTQIRCGEGRHHRRHHGASASVRGEAEPGDARGGRDELEPGDDPPGDDRSGRGLEPGDDRGQRGEGPPLGNDHPHPHPRGHGHHGERCDTGDLVPGAVVMRAEIVLTHGKALFKKIGLLPPQLAEPEAPVSG